MSSVSLIFHPWLDELLLAKEVALEIIFKGLVTVHVCLTGKLCSIILALRDF